MGVGGARTVIDLISRDFDSSEYYEHLHKLYKADIISGRSKLEFGFLAASVFKEGIKG